MNPNSKSSSLEFERLFAEATALYTAGELQSSLGLWLQAQALSRELGDTGREIKALSNTGAFLYSLGYLNEAENFQTEALLRKELLGDLAGEAVSLGNLGVIYQEWSHWAIALDCFQRARSLAQSVGDIAELCLRMAEIVMQSGCPYQP